MDIWSWVYDHLGQVAEEDRDLANQLDDLSTWTCDGDHAKVDAALPAMVARLRKARLSWLEVYARHWGLQSRVLHRYDVRGDTLQEAIDLLDRAHRDDAKDCPQSICVSQDVCAAYGIVDGPGYGEQRIQVAEETLSRIDRSWPCWRCITEERLSALRDLGRHEEALAEADAEQLKLKAAKNDGGDLEIARARALMALGRYDEALQAIRRHDGSNSGESGAIKDALYEATALLHLGRVTEALETVPAWGIVRGEVELYPLLMAFWREAFTRGALKWDLERTTAISEMLRTLSVHQAHRYTVDEGLTWADKALDQDATDLARVFLERAEAHLPHLVEPRGADTRCAGIRARLEAAQPEPYTLADLDTEGFRPERFDRLDRTVRELDVDVGWTLAVAEHWLRRGWPEEARALVEAALDADPFNARLLDTRFRSMASHGQWTELDAALRALPDDVPAEAEFQRRWYRGLLRYNLDDLAGAIEDTAWMWDNQRESCGPGVHRRLCAWLQASGDLERTLTVLDQVVASGQADSGVHWFRMEVATLLERWEVVRESGAAAELELDGDDGPIDMELGVVALEVEGIEGLCHALRTGPCTARMLAITGPGQPEVHGSLWAFEPFPQDDGPPPVYRAHRALEPSGARSYAVDGSRLTEAQLTRITVYAQEHGGEAFCVSGEAYSMWAPENDERYPASYVKVALAAPESEAGLAELLAEIATEHERPVIWPELREFLGDTQGAVHDRALAEAWRL